MSLEDEVARLSDSVLDIPKKVELVISDSIDSNRIARALEDITGSLSIIAREFK